MKTIKSFSKSKTKNRNMKARSILIGLIALFFLGTTQTVLAEKQDRNHKDFTKVAFALAGDVTITIGNTFSVTLEGDKNILDKVETEVDGDVLKIRREKGTRIHKKITVFITMPKLESAVVSGSGNIVTENAVNCADFRAVLSGSGSIIIDDLTADETSATISGSGNIKLVGKSGYSKMVISGSGSILSDNLETEKTRVVISGSGSAKVNATDELKSTISGSGSVYYKGKPRMDAKSSGSGRIRSID